MPKRRRTAEGIINKPSEGEVIIARGSAGVESARRRRCVEHVRSVLGVSERRVCRVLGQPRSTQRHGWLVRDGEQALTNDSVGLATRNGRYGYRRITALLRRTGWNVNHKRVERIWRRGGLKVPARQPKEAAVPERWVLRKP